MASTNIRTKDEIEQRTLAESGESKVCVEDEEFISVVTERLSDPQRVKISMDDL
jgi:hypothetical protein